MICHVKTTLQRGEPHYHTDSAHCLRKGCRGPWALLLVCSGCHGDHTGIRRRSAAPRSASGFWAGGRPRAPHTTALRPFALLVSLIALCRNPHGCGRRVVAPTLSLGCSSFANLCGGLAGMRAGLRSSVPLTEVSTCA